MFCYKTPLTRNTVNTLLYPRHTFDIVILTRFLSKIILVIIKHKHHMSYFRGHNLHGTPLTMSCWRDLNMTFPIII